MIGISGLADARRNTIPAERNPIDKSTVVSIYPKYIREVKHTIQPGVFELQPGTYDRPSILVVGSSSWWRDFDPEQPLIEITNSSIQVANSIVRDYCGACLATRVPNMMPGLYYVPGSWKLEQILSDKKPEGWIAAQTPKQMLNEAKTAQIEWYKALIHLADILWSQSNGNPVVIAEDMRLAARELGQQHKDWLTSREQLELVRCIACGSLRNPEFPICQSCKAVADPEKAKALGLTFVS